MKNINSSFKWVGLFAILLLPGLLYILLTTGKHEFETLEILYPKQSLSKINDTISAEIEYHTIPNFEFINQEGKEVNQNYVKNKIWIANYFFTTCPSICPVMNSSILKVQTALAQFSNFEILSFTVNPTHDNVEVLKEYAEKLGANTSNWNFLTGNKDNIYHLAFKGMFLGASEDSTAEGGFLHSESIVIIDKNGRIRSGKDKLENIKGAYDATNETDIQDLINDLKLLLAEYELEEKKEKNARAQ